MFIRMAHIRIISDGMGREVGAGLRTGNTCTPVEDSCQHMAKPIQYYKVISLKNKQNKTKQKTAGGLSCEDGPGTIFNIL